MQLLSQSGDLGPKWFHVALRTIVLISESDKLFKSHYIAEILEEDSTFIRKILMKLAKADIIETHSGRYGGYSLQKKPAEITVKDVYNAFDPDSPTPYWSVPSTGTELFISLIISKAEAEFQNILNNYTIEDIIKHKEVK